MAQVAGRKAARVGGRALGSALLDGGLHAHAILGALLPARAAGLRAHSTTKPLLSIVAEYPRADYNCAALDNCAFVLPIEAAARFARAATARPRFRAGHCGHTLLLRGLPPQELQRERARSC